MRKTFFSICLLMPSCIQSMENHFPGDSHRPVDEIFRVLFSDLLQPEIKEANNDRVVLALTEPRMNGSFNAIIDNVTVKLKIKREVEDSNDLALKEACANNLSYYKLLLKEKLAHKPSMDISYLKGVQLSRFIAFRTNDNLNTHMKEEEEQLQHEEDDSNETKNSEKKLKLQKKKA